MGKEHSIKITSISYYKDKDNWIGAGEVLGAKSEVDVVGLRIFVDGKEKYWLDLTIREALDIASNLTSAVNKYLTEHKKYIPNQE